MWEGHLLWKICCTMLSRNPMPSSAGRRKSAVLVPLLIYQRPITYCPHTLALVPLHVPICVPEEEKLCLLDMTAGGLTLTLPALCHIVKTSFTVPFTKGQLNWTNWSNSWTWQKNHKQQHTIHVWTNDTAILSLLCGWDRESQNYFEEGLNFNGGRAHCPITRQLLTCANYFGHWCTPHKENEYQKSKQSISLPFAPMTFYISS